MATTTKSIAVPTPLAMATPDADVSASQAAHAAKVMKDQSVARSAARPTSTRTLAARKPVVTVPIVGAEPPLAAVIAWRAAASGVPEAVLALLDEAIRRELRAPRVTLDKAEPREITEFLREIGLSNRQAAEALGLSQAILSTVQRANGDRWSKKRWLAAQPVLRVAAKKLATTKSAK